MRDDNRGTGRTTRQLLGIFKSIPHDNQCSAIAVFVAHNMNFAKDCFKTYLMLMSKIGNDNFKANVGEPTVTYHNGFVVKFTCEERVRSDYDVKRLTFGYEQKSITYDHAVFWDRP